KHIDWESYQKLYPKTEQQSYHAYWKSYREFVAERYAARWPTFHQSFGDIRQHGKHRCKVDVTCADASKREAEGFLPWAIDGAAPARRAQIQRQRVTRLWAHERCRKQRKRLLYLLKQPRTLLEARFFIHTLDWLLRQKDTHGRLRGPDLSTDKGVNCVS